MRRNALSRSKTLPIGQVQEVLVIEIQSSVAGSKFRTVTFPSLTGGIGEAVECDTFCEAEEAFASIFREKTSPVFRFIPLHLSSNPGVGGGGGGPSFVPNGVGPLLGVLLSEVKRSIVANDVDVSRLSPSQVDRAIVVLKEIQAAMDESDSGTIDGVTALDLSRQFFSALPFTRSSPERQTIDDAEKLASWFEVCANIRDTICAGESVVDLSEISDTNVLYQSLGCELDILDDSTAEFAAITRGVDRAKAKNVFRVKRALDFSRFAASVGNRRLMYHGTKASSLLGILARGLELPSIVVARYGVARTNAGNLGNSLYFSDLFAASVKYTAPSLCTGSRFMVLCDVALGKSFATSTPVPDLEAPPPGFDSVHGVAGDFFRDDEFAVFSPEQQRLRYIVEFELPDDSGRPLAPVDHQLGIQRPSADSVAPSSGKATEPKKKSACALKTSSGGEVPLEMVSVHARVVDSIAEVVIFFQFFNSTGSPVEGNFVFPLDEKSAVTGFEAFINNKHVVGVVKEKEQARREYKEAVERGDGAYLLDEAEENVFSMSLGNIPTMTRAVLRITYVSEIDIEGGCRKFVLPATLTGAEKAAATFQAQATTKTVQASLASATFRMELGIVTPDLIYSIRSPTHTISLKKASTRATVRWGGPTAPMSDFVLLIRTCGEPPIIFFSRTLSNLTTHPRARKGTHVSRGSRRRCGISGDGLVVPPVRPLGRRTGRRFHHPLGPLGFYGSCSPNDERGIASHPVDGSRGLARAGNLFWVRLRHGFPGAVDSDRIPSSGTEISHLRPPGEFRRVRPLSCAPVHARVDRTQANRSWRLRERRERDRLERR